MTSIFYYMLHEFKLYLCKAGEWVGCQHLLGHAGSALGALV